MVVSVQCCVLLRFSELLTRHALKKGVGHFKHRAKLTP